MGGLVVAVCPPWVQKILVGSIQVSCEDEEAGNVEYEHIKAWFGCSLARWHTTDLRVGYVIDNLEEWILEVWAVGQTPGRSSL